MAQFIVALALIASAQIPSAMNDVSVPFRITAISGQDVHVFVGVTASRAGMLKAATVLTLSGTVPARLVRTERKCEYLCGGPPNDEEVCHYEAVLRASRPVRDPVAVLPGRPTVQNVGVPAVGPTEPIGPVDAWIAAGPVPMVVNMWEGVDAEARSYRWLRFSDGVFLVNPDKDREFYAPPIDLASCTRRSIASLTLVSCSAAELLYEESRGVLLSVEEYGEGTVEPILRLRLTGSDAFIIRLGLKGEKTVALLIRDGAGWQIKFRGSERGTIC